MGWLKQRARKWLAASDNEIESNAKVPRGSSINSLSGDDFGGGLNIKIFNATGGRIVKFSSYNENTNKHYETVYLIHSDDDFEETLGQFITLEAIKHGQ